MRKVWKKTIGVLVAVVLIINSFMVSTFKTEAATYNGYANGKKLSTIKTSTDNSGYCSCGSKIGSGNHWCCWTYAANAYKSIWGQTFSRDNNKNSLKNVAAADRKFTVANLKKYLQNAAPGAVIRIDTNSTATASDSNGHSLIFCGLNSSGDGATFLEGNADGHGTSTLREKKFDSLYATYKNYTYIKYIIWPGGGNASINTPSTLSISGASLPSTINKGSYFDCKGTISSNYTITNITGKILKLDGTTVMYEHRVNPNSTSYNLAGSAIDYALKFNLLPAGTYYYKVWASDTKVAGKNMINRQFTVVDPNDSQITISNTKVTSVKDGVITFEFDVSASAGIKDVKCSAWPADWGGSTYKWIDTPSSVSGNHYTFKIDNKLWDYHTATYKIHAHVWDKNGKKVNTANQIECVVASSNLKIEYASIIPDLYIYDFYQEINVNLKGTVSSNYNLKTITARIYKEDGINIVSEAIVNPSNTKIYDLTSGTIENTLGFDKLTVGKYIYKLSASDVTGNAKTLLEQTFRVSTIDNAKPQTVKNVKASPAGKNKVKIAWNQVSDADGYLIYAKKNGTYAYCGLVTSKTKTYYTDTKAQDIDYNFYWVYAYKFDANNKRVVGACEHYAYAKGTCLRVGNLKATSLKGGVKISWSKSAGADGYIIYGKTKSGKYGYIGMTSKTTYTHTKASKSEYNFYWVFPYHNSTSGKRAIGPISAKYVYGKAK